MKIAFVADVHIENFRQFAVETDTPVNSRAELALTSLRVATDQAADNGCDTFVVLGDLFDRPRPHPALVRRVQSIFADAKTKGLSCHVVCGNHDRYSAGRYDNALAPLWQCARVVEEPTAMNELLLLPFMTDGPLPYFVDKGISVAGMHAGISDGETPLYLLGSSSVDVYRLRTVAEKAGVHTVVSGDWHRHKVWLGSINVIQCGTLAPTGFRDAGIACGTMVIVDSGRWTEKSGMLASQRFKVVNIAGPRFEIVDGPELPSLTNGFLSSRVFLKWRVPAHCYMEATERAREYIAADKAAAGCIGGVEVVPDVEDVREAAQAAAAATRGAGTLEAAVRAYVDEMALDPSADRERVAALAIQYLGAANG